MKIAIVDDDPSVREALARFLTVNDMECTAFSSGSRFLDSLTGESPDCLLLDLQMPDMSGQAVQRALREAGFFMPVIVITANRDSGVQGRALEAGAVACLAKPVDTDLLLGTIRRLEVDDRRSAMAGPGFQYSSAL